MDPGGQPFAAAKRDLLVPTVIPISEQKFCRTFFQAARSDGSSAASPSQGSIAQHPAVSGPSDRLYQRFARPSSAGEAPSEVSRLAQHGSPRQTLQRSADPPSAEVAPYRDAQSTQSSELRQAAQHRMNSATAVTIPPDGIRPVGPPHPERLYQRFARFPSGSATLSQDPHSARMDQLPQVHRNMAP